MTGAPSPRWRPLRELPPGAWRDVVGVFTDIDDTLTTDGAITPDALTALAELRAAGVHVIAVTGRPVGWSEAFALTWPLDAIVAENGAVALVRTPPAEGASGSAGSAQISSQIRPKMAPELRHQLSKLYIDDALTRQTNFAHLRRVAARVLREVPGATLAQDSPGRETDIAVDHSEFAHLGDAQIAQVVALMRAEGLQATVSSIHINGWIGDHNKWVGACWIARELLGIDDLAAQQERWVYIGDSTNDQVMFDHFTHSVGVANIARFADQLQTPPRYVTAGERGAGFAEMARLLLAQRQGD
ncbi:HAD hydrolase family protein [Ottowia sp. GY511]|uniref:HAD family hydrolase n=1 Tax=Ottowia flava TaxID=2675430 RepID=A0ABW4KRL0_9BURK|nr:HAD hydrolase family protein [Ottowia sp. GY511]TXK30880.1 HAD hydrolase family protein [Ottowia sp. GY511]